jgi:hypothetical protein
MLDPPPTHRPEGMMIDRPLTFGLGFATWNVAVLLVGARWDLNRAGWM